MNRKEFEAWLARTQTLGETGLFFSGKHLAALVQWLGHAINDRGNDNDPYRYTVIVTPFDLNLFKETIAANDHGYALRYYAPQVNPYIEEMPLVRIDRSHQDDLPSYDAVAVDFESPDLLPDEDGAFGMTGEDPDGRYIITDAGLENEKLKIVSAVEQRQAERKLAAEKERELELRKAEYLEDREQCFRSLPVWELEELWGEHEIEGFGSIEVEALGEHLGGDRIEAWMRYDEFKGVLKGDKGEIGEILRFDEEEENWSFHDLTVIPNKDTIRLVTDMGADAAVAFLIDDGGFVFEYQYCEGAAVKQCFYSRVLSVQSRVGVEPWDEGELFLDIRVKVDR